MSDRKEKSKKSESAPVEPAEEFEVTVETEGEGAEEKLPEDELRELNDRYLRVCADFDNFRRRTRLDRAAGYEEGIIESVRALLPVVDSIDGAVKAAGDCVTDETREYAEGVSLIAQQLAEALKALGVTEIDGEGSAFNPALHQVVIHGEDEELPENHVIEVYQKGYRKGDRVIRHSMVRVVN
ncbi:MAG: nucleotide exchange factor GrpE [Clostridiaceae bacterium]|nr:nucleotide exchange factor GrpE [Clostridiaceae bacterium]